MPRDYAQRDSNRAASALTVVAIIVALGAALYLARVILIPLALAIYFTFILTPLVIVLQRRGLGRLLSIGLVVGAGLIAIGVVGLVVGLQVAQLTETLPDHADRIKAKVATVKGWLTANDDSRFATLVNDIAEMFKTAPQSTGPGPDGSPPTTVVVENSPQWTDHARALLSPAVEVLGQAAFTLILLVFMLLRREDLRNRAIRLLGPGQITTTTKAVDDASRRISSYLLAQFLLNTAFGLVIAMGLFLMGVPYATLWGFIAFLMRYVPYVGTWIGLIPPALFTLAISDGWGWTIGVVALFLGLELVCNNFIEPFLYGSRLGLSEVAQLVATALWAFLWGPVGMILAWPLTTCLLILGKYVPQFRFLSVLLGDQPVLTPRVAFYQRLAARDQDEAAEIVEKEIVERPIPQVFDDLLIPALASARRDLADGRLSDDDVRFATDSIREIAEATAEFKREAEGQAAESRVRALLVPASDIADETAARVFALLLDPDLWEIEVVPASTLASELLERIEATSPSSVVIASLPPGGLTHTRYLCKRIRQQFPDVKVAVGRWTGVPEEGGKAARQLRESGAADELAFTLEATLTFMNGWRAVFEASSPSTKSKSGARSRSRSIGTARALLRAGTELRIAHLFLEERTWLTSGIVFAAASIRPPRRPRA